MRKQGWKRAGGNFQLSGRCSGIAESELAAAARQGEAAAFEELCRSHAAKILGIAYRITKNREDAEDALQESFLKAFVHIQDFDGRSSFSTWLTRIAINSALMILRTRRSSVEFSMDDNGGNEPNPVFVNLADGAPNPEVACAQRERDEILHCAVGELRPAIRNAVEVRIFHEHSLEETAEMLGVSVPAAKSRLHQARAELRTLLASKHIGHAHAGSLRFAPVL
jgi:RNA polymerase sigma-70 factor (ECF subfamily)